MTDHEKDGNWTQEPTTTSKPFSNVCDLDEKDMTSSESSLESIEYRGLKNPLVSCSLLFFFSFFISAITNLHATIQ